MSSRLKKIMALVNKYTPNDVSVYNSDSDKSLSLLRSSMSSTSPGYIEVDPSIIMISKSYQETPKTSVQENSSIRKQGINNKIGLNNSFESDKDDDNRDPDYELGNSSEDTSEDNSELNVMIRRTKLSSTKISNKDNILKNTSPAKIIQKEIPSKTVVCNNKMGFDSSQDNELDNGISDKSPMLKEISVDHRLLNVANSLKTTKKHFCLFCKKMQSKFARHLENKHLDKPQVKLFLSLPKKSKERHHIIDKLRKEGDFIYNSDSLYNQGDIIVVRRPQVDKNRNAEHYFPCAKCSAMYSKLSINAHYRLCVKNRQKFKKDILCASRLKVFVNLKAHYLMKNKILPPMRNNDINALVRREELIILFGNRLTQKYRSPHLFKMIRSRLRCVGTFFWLFKKQRPEVTKFENVFDPIYYDDVIRSINKMTGLNEETGKYRAPSTAACICSYLKKICLYLVSELIKRIDKTNLERVRDFYQLMQDGFTYDIYKTVSENQMEIKMHKVVKLPSSNDINLLRDYLDKYIRYNFKLLNEKWTENCWKELSGAVLVSLQLFNRRRAGEIERVKICDFKEYEAVDITDDLINQNLPISMKQNYVRFVIRGKRGRGVPVLVDKFKLKCLKFILKYREMANVPPKNPFLFGIPGKDDMQHLEANRLMNRFAHRCGANNPETLKGTELRKHFATKCGTMDLQGIDIKDVADYMGHHERIHLEHYRMPNATRDILRMSRLLEKAQGVDSPISHENSESLENFDELVQDESLEANSKQNQSPPLYAGIQNPMEEFNITPEEKRRISWSKEEKKLVETKANFYLENFESPTMEFCSSLVKEAALKKRSATTLKAYIMNEIKRRKTNVFSSPEQKKKCKRGVKKFWTQEEKEKVFEVFQESLISKKLPGLALCKKVITEHKIFNGRTPEMLKAFISNVLRKNKLRHPHKN